MDGEMNDGWRDEGIKGSGGWMESWMAEEREG